MDLENWGNKSIIQGNGEFFKLSIKCIISKVNGFQITVTGNSGDYGIKDLNGGTALSYK